jgi:hypothetical protein
MGGVGGGKMGWGRAHCTYPMRSETPRKNMERYRG